MRKVVQPLLAPVPGAIAAFLALYLAFQLFDFPWTHALGGDLFFVAIDGIAVLAAWKASRRCRESTPLCRFWQLFAVALCGQLAGDALMAYYDATGTVIPFPSFADPAYFSFYVLAALALIRVPVAPTNSSQRVRIALDLTSVVLVGAMTVWYFAVAPTILAGGLNAVQMATSIAYPIGDIVILAALAVVALSWSPPALRRSLQLIAGGLALFVVADIAYAFLVFHGGYTAGGPLDTLWIVALCSFALAGAEQPSLTASATEGTVPERPETERRASWLPYVALAFGSAILLSAEWHTPFIPQLSVLLIGIGVASVVAVRQFLAQGELILLQNRLHEAHDELARLASHDPLTEMRNRRSFDRTLIDELAVARRYGRRLSVLFLDLDHFKWINDSYGHAAGDDVLKEMSCLLEDAVRTADVAARWGGEEFVVLLPETGATDAFDLAERIRERVEKDDFAFQGGHQHMTCSIGVSTHPEHGSEPGRLILAADKAAYAAKRGGRNLVIAASLGQAEPAHQA
jgi:diguanylate cyclase (GGDEF)-like protein